MKTVFVSWHTKLDESCSQHESLGLLVRAKHMTPDNELVIYEILHPTGMENTFPISFREHRDE